MAHPGSWTIGGLRLPDFGATEFLGDILGGGRTAEGGSNIVPQNIQSQVFNPNTIGPGGTTVSVLGEETESPRRDAAFPGIDPNEGRRTSTGIQTTGVQTTGGGDREALINAMMQRGHSRSSAESAIAGRGVGDLSREYLGGGGGGGNIESLISDMYGPSLDVLRGIEGDLLSGQQTALTNIGEDFTGGQETIGRERGELEASLAEQERRLAESGRSAVDEATRMFNNLIQQGLSRFGAGSSAGPAVQELVNREFLRSRAGIGRQRVAGEQQIAQEQGKLSNYINQKFTDLDKWKRDAIQKINDNFTASMQEVNLRRGDIEANKTRDKIAALQNAVNQAEGIKTADRQYRLGLAQFAVEQMQEFSNRAFTPQEIASVVNQFMNQEISGFGARVGQGETTPFTGFRPTGSSEDELEGLINPVAQ